jgi:malate dehydrogenase
MKGVSTLYLQIAARVGVSAQDIHNVIIWGNHSSTQFPDVAHATVNVGGTEVKVTDAVKDDSWLKGDFISVRLTVHAALVCCERRNFFCQNSFHQSVF